MLVVRKIILPAICVLAVSLLGPSTANQGLIREAYAKVLTSAEKVLDRFLADADEVTEEVKVLTEDQKSAIAAKARVTFDPVFDREFSFFIGRQGGQVIGYAAKHAVKGKWGMIHYMIALDPDGTVREVKVLEYQERRGKPVAKRRFLKQFKGKTIQSRIKLRKDIHGVTGATISSRGMTDGVRKLVHVFHEFYVKK